MGCSTFYGFLKSSFKLWSTLRSLGFGVKLCCSGCSLVGCPEDSELVLAGLIKV